jgi:hypothetical protein
LKAALIGTGITFIIVLMEIMDQGFGLPEIGSTIILALLVPLVMAFATVVIGLCLMFFGWPLARLSHPLLASSGGVLIAVSGAVAVMSALIALVDIRLWAEPFALLITASFAIPAALFYRDDILTERVLD